MDGNSSVLCVLRNVHISNEPSNGQHVHQHVWGSNPMTPKGPAEMSNHQAGKFGEPWTYHNHEGNCYVVDSMGMLILRKDTRTGEIVPYKDFVEHERYLERATQCLNACAALANPSALPALLEACERLDRETMDAGQRDLTQTSIAALHIMVNAIAKALRAVKPQQRETFNLCAGVRHELDPDALPKKSVTICGEPISGDMPKYKNQPAERGEAE
jgi:hypothetical protein